MAMSTNRPGYETQVFTDCVMLDPDRPPAAPLPGGRGPNQ